jgi:hypothetical protein
MTAITIGTITKIRGMNAVIVTSIAANGIRGDWVSALGSAPLYTVA